MIERITYLDLKDLGISQEALSAYADSIYKFYRDTNNKMFFAYYNDIEAERFDTIDEVEKFILMEANI